MWYGEGCKSSDATERCDCTATFVTEVGQGPKCYRGGDYPGSIRWFFKHNGCFNA
jgi:hypothetical protein